MLKWQDNLSHSSETRLEALAGDLRRIKSKGWSVVFSKNEIIVRPEDRSLGKFSIILVKEQFSVSFFSRELNIWSKRAYFPDTSALEVSVREWMESAVLDSNKYVDR